MHQPDYQNLGAAVEIFAPAGTKLDGWKLALYNGATGKVFKEHKLEGIVKAIEPTNYGVLFVPTEQITNGGPNGLSLSTPSGHLVRGVVVTTGRR